MNDNINNNDDDIVRKALEHESRGQLPDSIDEPSVFEAITETMRGRKRWLSILGFIYTVVFLIAAIVCGVQFFRAETMQAMLAWGGGTLLFAYFVSMLKIWFFLEMNKNAMTREIKRLELQIARLTSHEA